jgi:hypothetical protein
MRFRNRSTVAEPVVEYVVGELARTFQFRPPAAAERHAGLGERSDSRSLDDLLEGRPQGGLRAAVATGGASTMRSKQRSSKKRWPRLTARSSMDTSVRSNKAASSSSTTAP